MSTLNDQLFPITPSHPRVCEGNADRQFNGALTADSCQQAGVPSVQRTSDLMVLRPPKKCRSNPNLTRGTSAFFPKADTQLG